MHALRDHVDSLGCILQAQDRLANRFLHRRRRFHCLQEIAYDAILIVLKENLLQIPRMPSRRHRLRYQRELRTTINSIKNWRKAEKSPVGHLQMTKSNPNSPSLNDIFESSCSLTMKANFRKIAFYKKLARAERRGNN